MRRGRLQADEAALGSLENDEQSTVQSAGVAQTVADRSVPALARPCLHNVTKRRCLVMQLFVRSCLLRSWALSWTLRLLSTGASARAWSA
jgi:hypothetical protein